MEKRLRLFMAAMLAVFSFAFTSCGDDEDEEDLSSNDSQLVGTWQEDDELASALEYDVYIRFGSDGTFTEVDIFSDGEVDVSVGNWSKSGSSLQISGGDFEKTTSTIKSLSSKKLVLSTLGIETTYKKVSDSKIEKYL